MLGRVEDAEGTLFTRLEVEILGRVRPDSAASTDFHRFPLDVAERHCDYCQDMRGTSMKRRSVWIPSQIWREPPTTTADHRRTPVVVGVYGVPSAKIFRRKKKWCPRRKIRSRPCPRKKMGGEGQRKKSWREVRMRAQKHCGLGGLRPRARNIG